MKRVSFEDMDCSIAQSLEVVGEWWTPLILREVFFGRRRFEEILDDLGISRNILTDRLNRLVDDEVLYRHNVAHRGARYEYRLTDKGVDLFPVLVALMQWGDRWRSGTRGAPTELVHTTCGHETSPVLSCSHCGETVAAPTLRARPGKGRRRDPDHPLVRAAAQA
jgi:DNA-binding HxlR family transcriptional regulator